MFPEIIPSSILFEKMLSIRVLECVVTREGVEIYGRRKFAYNESRNEAWKHKITHAVNLTIH